jgi:hypothetical protein
MLDADMLFVKHIDDLLLQVERRQALAGLIALGSPFWPDDPDRWQRIFATAGLGDAPLVEEHTNWRPEYGDSPFQYCPPYFNLGMLVAPRAVMTALGTAVFQELDAIDSCGWTHFRCQIAVTLALHRRGLPYIAARRRFNFPNKPDFWDAFPADAADVRLLHYLDTEEIDRVTDFADDERFAALRSRVGLHPVNQLLVDVLRDDHA